MKHRAARLLVVLCLALAASALPAAEDMKLMPVDEGAQDRSWLHFRARLLDAIARGDHEAVLSIVAPNVRNSMGAPAGIAEFRKRWDVDDAASPLWSQLASALFLGSAWMTTDKGQRELCAPYVAVNWPDGLDAAAYGAITVKDALLKRTPSNNADTLTELSYDIVHVDNWEVSDTDSAVAQKWVAVRAGEAQGFVPAEAVRSAIEHRACFLHTARGWRMTSFLLGIER